MRKYYDKILHAFVCAFLVSLMASVLALDLAILITLVIGIAKEAIDAIRKDGTGFDLYDLLADIVGITIGSLLWL